MKPHCPECGERGIVIDSGDPYCQPTPESCEECGADAFTLAQTKAILAQWHDEYDGPDDASYEDTGESPSYRSQMIDAGRSHLL